MGEHSAAPAAGSNVPIPKVTAAGAAGAAVVVATYAAALFGVDVPAEVSAAVATIAAFAAGWLTR
jgi:hypothetical protein